MKHVVIFHFAAGDSNLLPVFNDHWQQNNIEHIGQFPLSLGDLMPVLIQSNQIEFSSFTKRHRFGWQDSNSAVFSAAQ